MENFIEIVAKELGFSTQHFPINDRSAIYYRIVDKDNTLHSLNIEWDLFDDDIKQEIKEQFKTLLYNSVWPNAKHVYLKDEFYDFIENAYPSKHPSEKLNRVLLYIQSLMSYDGQKIKIDEDEVREGELWRASYVKNAEEFFFYLDSLLSNNLLVCKDSSSGDYYGVGLTVEGLNKIVQIEELQKSRTCFIAMSFDEDLKEIYEQAIQPVVKECGYEAYIVRDEKRTPSDVTINDEILSAIKKAKFTIADFTRHKNGVYFEAGYALGRGQKVIYTCKEEDISRAHFDTRNYAHIVWKDVDDLKKQLKDKIEVFIKE